MKRCGSRDKFPWPMFIAILYSSLTSSRPATKRVTGIKRIVRRVFTRSFDNSRQYKTPCAAALPFPFLAFSCSKENLPGLGRFSPRNRSIEIVRNYRRVESESFKPRGSFTRTRWLKYTRDIWIRTSSLRARFFFLLVTDRRDCYYGKLWYRRDFCPSRLRNRRFHGRAEECFLSVFLAERHLSQQCASRVLCTGRDD